jgi:hypothetical protein
MAEAGIVTITNSCFGKNLSHVANNIISVDKVTDDTIAEAIGSAILRSNVSSEPVDGGNSGPGSLVESGSIYPKSGDVPGKNGFFDRLLRRSKPSATPSPHIYNGEELGRLLMLTRESE